MLTVGYAYEQASLARVPPNLTAEPWIIPPCALCNPIQLCFLQDGCLLRDMITGNWTGDAVQCNDFAPSCEECFPDSPCYLGGDASSSSSSSGNATTSDNITQIDMDTTINDNNSESSISKSNSSSIEQDGSVTNPSAGRSMLSKWGLSVAGWTAVILLHTNIL